MNTTKDCKWCGKSYRLDSREDPKRSSFPGYLNPLSLWCCEKCLYEWEVANKCVGLKAEEYKEWASKYEDAKQQYRKRKEEREKEIEIRKYETAKRELRRDLIICTIVLVLPSCAMFCYGVATEGLPHLYTAVLNYVNHRGRSDVILYVFGPGITLVATSVLLLFRYMTFYLFEKP